MYSYNYLSLASSASCATSYLALHMCRNMRETILIELIDIKVSQIFLIKALNKVSFPLDLPDDCIFETEIILMQGLKILYFLAVDLTQLFLYLCLPANPLYKIYFDIIKLSIKK